MKKLPLLLVLFALMAQAQIHRFVYEYQFAPDINKKDSTIVEMMALDISDKGSEYQSLMKIKSDSSLIAQVDAIKSSNGAINSIDMRGLRAKVNTVVLKEYPSFKTYLQTSLGRDYFKVIEDEKQVWHILPETKKIDGYNAQKATTSWGGRDWSAWFTTDLPFPDGPYKFSGLPGLIVEIEDSTGTQKMSLKANSNYVMNSKYKATHKSEVTIDEEKFKKLRMDYINDPGNSIKQIMSSSEDKIRGADGKPIDSHDMVMAAQSAMKRMLKNYNNYIEPSLYDIKK